MKRVSLALDEPNASTSRAWQICLYNSATGPEVAVTKRILYSDGWRPCPANRRADDFPLPTSSVITATAESPTA